MEKVHKNRKYMEGDVIPVGETGRFVEIVKYESRNRVKFRSMETGYEGYSRITSVKSGNFKDLLAPSVFGVGYLGGTKFKSGRGGGLGGHTEEYISWKSMLSRVYGGILRGDVGNYSGCSVREDWHNFQTYAEWFVAQYREGVWHLEKDLIKPKNKVYSPDTCFLSPPDINGFLSIDRVEGDTNPVGVHYKPRQKEFHAQISKGGEKIHLGYYNCPDKAFKVYREAKNDHARELADKWEGRVDERAIQALRKFDIVNYI